MTGTVLGGRYRLDELIAAGGMGEVWRAFDETLGRAVAVKLMHSQLSHDPGFLERFRAEARNTAALSHPGIATVYDYGEATSTDRATRAFLVMELIEGHSLHEILEQSGRLPAERTLDIVAQVGSALHAAHTAGVVHRDVKPANLLVRPDGSVVVTDFGIARSVHATGNLTVTGQVMGTAAYIAPEQAEGKPASPATDVYSLGIVAYQCLAGRRPFDADTPVATALAHLRETPPPLPPDVPPPVRGVVEHAMAKDPADRFASAAALAHAARAIAADPFAVPSVPPVPPVPPMPPTRAMPMPPSAPPPQVTSRLRKHPAVLGGVAAGVILALLLGVGIAVAMFSGRSTSYLATTDRIASVPTASASAASAAAAEKSAPAFITLDVADYVGQPVDVARKELVALGLEVNREFSRQRGQPGRVVGLTPTRIKAGDTVTLLVAQEWTRKGPKKDPKQDHDEDEQGDD
jgi:serine/threonine-protein kinase